MRVKVVVYDLTKYESDSKKVAEHIYDDVDRVEVKTINDNSIYNDGYDQIDEHREYAVITFTDGSTATFRNSHVDIFRD